MGTELDWPSIVERLFFAAVMGGVIGWERGHRNKQAGLKTHLLVALGSALITVTSIYGFLPYLKPGTPFDPTRIPAQIVSGIGFLGAGAILRRSDWIVQGLTTAATLWVVAGIGIAAGSGFYFPAAVTTFIVLVSTMFLPRFEDRFLGNKKTHSLTVVVDDRPGKLGDISMALGKYKVDVVQIAIHRAEGDVIDDYPPRVVVEAHVVLPSKTSAFDVVAALEAIDGVHGVECV